MTGRRSHGRLSALNGVVHQGSIAASPWWIGSSPSPPPPITWHTYTETVVILQGAVDINLDGTEYTATEGSYVIIPGGAHHDWRVHADADVVLLARRDGPPDFNFVGR